MITITRLLFYNHILLNVMVSTEITVHGWNNHRCGSEVRVSRWWWWSPHNVVSWPRASWNNNIINSDTMVDYSHARLTGTVRYGRHGDGGDGYTTALLLCTTSLKIKSNAIHHATESPIMACELAGVRGDNDYLVIETMMSCVSLHLRLL